MPSPRLAAEAAFHRALLDGDPAALEKILRAPEAPAASRRARAVLGERATLDALDERLLAAIRLRPDWAKIDRIGGGEGGAWGLDERRSAVWTSSGRTV